MHNGDTEVAKNQVLCCVLCQKVSKTLIIPVFFAIAAEEHVYKLCFLLTKPRLTITKYRACAQQLFGDHKS